MWHNPRDGWAAVSAKTFTGKRVKASLPRGLEKFSVPTMQPNAFGSPGYVALTCLR
jgi:hypothetical protein